MEICAFVCKSSYFYENQILSC